MITKKERTKAQTLASSLGQVGGDVGDQGVKLLLGLLVVVPLAGKADTNPVGNVLDSASPDLLVQAGVHTHVLGAHLRVGELADGLDGLGSALLEGGSVNVLVQVNGVLAGHHILQGGPGLLSNICLDHCSA